MKTLTKTAIVLSTLFFIYKCNNRPTENYNQVIETQQVEVSSDTSSYEVANQESENQYVENTNKYYNPNQTIVIKGLGYIDNSDLEYAASLVKEFYGYNCVISDNIETPQNLYMSEGVIDAHKTIMEFVNSTTRTIYLTYESLYVDNMELRGYTTTYGNTVVIKYDRSFLRETLVHEIGHTLGLHHCDDLTCIMAINNDAYDKGDFCEKCKNMLNNLN